MNGDTERLAAQTRRIAKLKKWVAMIHDKGRSIPISTLQHRLEQIIKAGDNE